MALCLPTACRPADLEHKSLAPHVAAEDGDVKARAHDPKLDASIDQDQDAIAIPQNVSGQYLVACHVTGAQSTTTSSPAKVDLKCGLTDEQGQAVPAEGTWAAALRDPSGGETLSTIDSRQGTFALSSAQSSSLVTMTQRMTVQFRGNMEGSEFTVVQTNFSMLAQEIQKVQQSLPVTYEFTIKVVSGTLSGQTYTGSFSYDPKLLKGQGAESIVAQSLQFNYLPANQQSFDSSGNLSFNNGTLVSLAVTGGPGTKRFGINAGFDRNQFGRTSEAFVRNGDPYFAYMNSSALVDGAGTISYLRK